MQTLEIPAFLDLGRRNPIIDVRSPGEYDKGHIPNAVNIPLFSNEERAKVGTSYKQCGREEALQLGLKIVGPKLADFVTQSRQLNVKNHLLIHCWRGGMRSQSFSWLLDLAGLANLTLNKGYKNYRNFLMDQLSQPLKLIVLTGSTGSGKSDLLAYLKSKGEQVLELEELACHKGSVFGGLGQPEQPSSEQFQNNLFERFLEFEIDRPIWIEDESIGIGNVFIPEPLWHQMNKAPCVRIELEKDERIQRLMNEYGMFPVDLLEEKIKRVAKRLGDKVAPTIDSLHSGDLKTTVSNLLFYYDKAYNNSIIKKPRRTIATFQLESFELDKIYNDLLKIAEKHYPITKLHD